MKSFCKWVLLIFLMLKMEGNISSQTEQSFGQRLRNRCFLSIRILLEIVKVAAPVKDVELLFILTNTVYILTQSCTTTNHLHELNLGLHRFEEHKVQDIRYIYTCIKHIHRHCNLRVSIPHFKLVNKVLCVGHTIVNQSTERWTIFRV